MTNLKSINNLRRNVTQNLTRNLGKRSSSQLPICTQNENIKNILVTRPNHRLGNLLLITPLLQDLENIFPNAKIDVFLKGGLGPIILKNYKNIDEIIFLPKEHFKQLPSYIFTWFKLRRKKYDLVINTVPHSSSGRLSTKLARSRYKIFGDNQKHFDIINPNNDHIAKRPVYYFRKSLTAKTIANAKIPSLNLKLSSNELDQGKKVLKNILGNNKQVITMFTYATEKKCHSKIWWQEFYSALQVEFPNHSFLEVLPKENVSQINFEAHTYYSKDLREICSVIANTHVFIGADSGMMHLAVASKIPVIGLFNVTNLKKYRPYDNRCEAINTTTTSTSELIDKLKTILNPKPFK